MVPDAVKKSFDPAFILKVGLTMITIFLIGEATGFTGWILAPLSSFKAKFSKSSGN